MRDFLTAQGEKVKNKLAGNAKRLVPLSRHARGVRGRCATAAISMATGIDEREPYGVALGCRRLMASTPRRRCACLHRHRETTVDLTEDA